MKHIALALLTLLALGSPAKAQIDPRIPLMVQPPPQINWAPLLQLQAQREAIAAQERMFREQQRQRQEAEEQAARFAAEARRQREQAEAPKSAEQIRACEFAANFAAAIQVDRKDGLTPVYERMKVTLSAMQIPDEQLLQMVSVVFSRVPNDVPPPAVYSNTLAACLKM